MNIPRSLAHSGKYDPSDTFRTFCKPFEINALKNCIAFGAEQRLQLNQMRASAAYEHWYGGKHHECTMV